VFAENGEGPPADRTRPSARRETSAPPRGQRQTELPPTHRAPRRHEPVRFARVVVGRHGGGRDRRGARASRARQDGRGQDPEEHGQDQRYRAWSGPRVKCT